MMNRFSNFSLKRKLVFLFIPFFFISTLAISISYYYISLSNIKDGEIRLMQNKTEQFNDLVKNNINSSLLLLGFISNMEEIKSAYMNTDNEAGYNTLKSTILPIIEKLGYDPKVFQLHFHKPPAISFYRVFSKKRNDDISKFRHTVVKTYETKEPVYGLEHGSFAFGVRTIIPLFDEKKNYLGSVEVIKDMPELVQMLNDEKSEKVDMITVVDYNYISSFVDAEYIDKNYHISFGNFRISKSDNKSINISNLIEVDELNELLKSKSKKFILKDGNVVGLIPIIDFQGNVPGVFVFITDVSQKIDSTVKNVIWIIGIIIFSAIIIIWIITIIIDIIIVKPINKVIIAANRVSEGDF